MSRTKPSGSQGGTSRVQRHLPPGPLAPFATHYSHCHQQSSLIWIFAVPLYLQFAQNTAYVFYSFPQTFFSKLFSRTMRLSLRHASKSSLVLSALCPLPKGLGDETALVLVLPPSPPSSSLSLFSPPFLLSSLSGLMLSTL